MKTSLVTGWVALLLASAALAAPAASPVGTLPMLQRMNAQFAPVGLTGDLRGLPDNERHALALIIEAAQIMDGLFLRQVSAANPTLLLELAKDMSPLGRARFEAFIIHKGPWSRLEHNTPFIPGVGAEPVAGDFYPAGSTKVEVERWFKSLPEPQRKVATGFYTTVRRTPEGGFIAVPYSIEYQGQLAAAARLLREAAALTSQPTLRKFLGLRADAFLSNDYYASDVAWMELDSSIEPTIGAYEVYEDEWFNAKAAFQGSISLRDAEESRKLEKFSGLLQDLESHLPIDAKLRNPKIGALAPISVVNLIYSSGDANRGVQTAAFNLPNDERITQAKGAKRVMLKNMQEAKFRHVLLPIAQVVLSPADRRNVAFDTFFTHILMHELVHGLGPHDIQVQGRATTVRQELQASSSAMEEAKADVAGLWAMQYLIDKGVIGKEAERTMYTTYLASMFRSIRFGLTEAHGLGVALQLNTFLDSGAVTVSREGLFAVVPAKFRESVTTLSRDLMVIQAAGDRAKAEALLARMGVIRPEVQRALDRLKRVPVDIRPGFPTAEQLVRESGSAAAPSTTPR